MCTFQKCDLPPDDRHPLLVSDVLENLRRRSVSKVEVHELSCLCHLHLVLIIPSLIGVGILMISCGMFRGREMPSLPFVVSINQGSSGLPSFNRLVNDLDLWSSSWCP